jgi:hypothetical protein
LHLQPTNLELQLVERFFVVTDLILYGSLLLMDKFLCTRLVMTDEILRRSLVLEDQGFDTQLGFVDACLLAVLLLQKERILLPQQLQVLQVIVPQSTDQHHLLVLNLPEM